jgi:hypothetical protein
MWAPSCRLACCSVGVSPNTHIRTLWSDTVSTSNCAASNVAMNSDQWTGRDVEGIGPELISNALMEFSSRGWDRPRHRNERRSSAEISTTFWADGLACLSDPIWRLALGFAGNFEYLLSRNAVLWLRLVCWDYRNVCVYVSFVLLWCSYCCGRGVQPLTHVCLPRCDSNESITCLGYHFGVCDPLWVMTGLGSRPLYIPAWSVLPVL